MLKELLAVITNDTLVEAYVFWGAIGAIIATLVKFTIEKPPKKDHWLLTFLAYAYQILMNGIIGSLIGILANHNIRISFGVGFVSQFVLLYLVEWLYSDNFKSTLVNFFKQAITSILKTVLRNVDDPEENK